MTIEQMCRNLLHRAVCDELLSINPKSGRSFTSEFSSGDLIGMANLLIEYVQDVNGIDVEGSVLSLRNENAPMSKTFYVS